MRKAFGLVLVTLLIFLFTSAAYAKKPILVVTYFATEPEQENLSPIPAEAIMDSARHQNEYTVLHPNILKMRMGKEKIPTCDNAECAKKFLEAAGADVAIYGYIDKTEKAYMVKAGAIRKDSNTPKTVNGLLAGTGKRIPKYLSRALFFVIIEEKYKTITKKADVLPKSKKKVKGPSFMSRSVPSEAAALYFINEKGKVKAIRPLAFTSEIAWNATKSYLKKIRYNPALSDNKPVSVWCIDTFHWVRLKGNKESFSKPSGVLFID